ncbi:MAG: M48 family metalloprotease [Acidobacteriota bacterium]
MFVVIIGCAACAAPRGSPSALSDIAPGQRPALHTDEAGLWMVMDRMEERLRSSGRLLTDTNFTAGGLTDLGLADPNLADTSLPDVDLGAGGLTDPTLADPKLADINLTADRSTTPDLHSYVRQIVCKLAGSYCSDIRVYVVQNPHFNATMAPNGAMQVWTGLILRAENEAQLACVLGHELGHYLRRHTLQQFRDVRSKADFLAFLSVAAALAGAGYVGPLATLIALGSVYKFSRDQEREADELGFELMVRAGYDPREASRIWEVLVKEREAAEDPDQFIFFSTHPPTDERIETLKEMAEKAVADEEHWFVGKERFRVATLPLRATFLRDELRQREFARSQVVLDRLFESDIGLGELNFFQGKLHRLRGEEGDEDKAIAAYQKALGFEDAPEETNRDLGLLFFRAGAKDKARSYFEQYIQGRPDAEDAEMIKTYLEQLK